MISPLLCFCGTLFSVQLLLTFSECLSLHSNLNSLKWRSCFICTNTGVGCLGKLALKLMHKHIILTHMRWQFWAHFFYCFFSDSRLDSLYLQLILLKIKFPRGDKVSKMTVHINLMNYLCRFELECKFHSYLPKRQFQTSKAFFQNVLLNITPNTLAAKWILHNNYSDGWRTS